VRGARWFAVAFAFAGLVLVVAPWHWQGGLASKLWAVLSGFGWAAGTVATKYYQRKHRLDMLNFVAWQMVVGVIPLTLLPWCFAFETTGVEHVVRRRALLHRRDLHRPRLRALDRGAASPACGHGPRSTCSRSR